MGIACSNASARTTRSVISRRHKTEAFSHLLKLPNNAAENKLGLSLVGIRVFPVYSFNPHANPIPGTNSPISDAWCKGPGYPREVCVQQRPQVNCLWWVRSQSAVYQIFKKFADSSSLGCWQIKLPAYGGGV